VTTERPRDWSMKIIDSRNPNFGGWSRGMRKDTVCFVDVDGWLCYIPFGTMKWYFETHVFNHSFHKWLNKLSAKDYKK
jgi:hypothetical protein